VLENCKISSGVCGKDSSPILRQAVVCLVQDPRQRRLILRICPAIRVSAFAFLLQHAALFSRYRRSSRLHLLPQLRIRVRVSVCARVSAPVFAAKPRATPPTYLCQTALDLAQGTPPCRSPRAAQRAGWPRSQTRSWRTWRTCQTPASVRRSRRARMLPTMRWARKRPHSSPCKELYSKGLCGANVTSTVEK